jgi:signal transduction histidine kinase
VDFKIAFSRLTGRHVLGPGVFWSTLGFGLLAHGLGSADIALASIPGRVAAVAIAHLAMMAVVYLVRAATFKLKPGLTSLIFVVSGYALAGAARGLILQASLFEFGIEPNGFSIYRLVGGIGVMATALAWTAFAFGIKAEWGAKRANLSATKQQLETLLAESESRLALEATDTLSTIESMLQTALIPELMVTPQLALTKLQSLINDTLRPLSASLAANQPKIDVVRLDPSAYRFHWRTLLTHLKLKESSRPVTLALILAVLAINGFVKYIPHVNPGLLILLSVTVLATGLAIERYWLSRWVDQLPVGIRVPTVLALLFTAGLVGGLVVLSQTHDLSITLSLSVNAGVAATLLGSLFGINHAAAIEMKSIENQLLDYEHTLRWTIAAVNSQHWLQKKQFARKIHGPIQSEVAAAAIRIERGLNSGEVTESGAAALQNLRDRLGKILNDTKGIADVRPVLAEITETWHGLCQIDFELSGEDEELLRRDPICVETVLEIAREACSNAIRHGSAEQIKLHLDFGASDLVRITVENDGAKTALGSRRGVGSAYLDDCTYSHSLTQTEVGTLLVATIPYREQ